MRLAVRRLNKTTSLEPLPVNIVELGRSQLCKTILRVKDPVPSTWQQIENSGIVEIFPSEQGKANQAPLIT